MILLPTTNDTLELITGSSGSVDYYSSYADLTTTTFTPADTSGNITTATTTTITSAPSASTQRQIKLLTIRNRSTNSQTVTVQRNSNGTISRLTPDIVLASGEVLQFLDGRGFSVLDPFAAAKGVTKSEITNPPTYLVPWNLADENSETAIRLLLAEQRITNLLLIQAMGINSDIESWISTLTSTRN